jgi:hypothetical protein
MPKTKFFLAAACLFGSSALLNAATIFPTSPLIQIGDDTDIFFSGELAFDYKDNLFSVADKKSAMLLTFTPGFEIEYAKDSPISINVTAARSFLRYDKSEYKDLEQGQDNITGSIYYDTGGPLTVKLFTAYNESARNDNLANALGGDGAILGATLVRQALHTHDLKVAYKLTEKISVNVGFINSYNHYLNPTKTTTTVGGLPDVAYNTNTLSEINTKSIPINITYTTPSDKLVYGLSFKHDVSNYSPAPYFHTYNGVSVSRPPLSQKMTQDFYGFTVDGQPTSSGKIHITTRFGYFNSDLDGVATNGASYNFKISHNLTERFTHELSLSHELTPGTTGGILKTDTLIYSGIYSLSEKFSLNFSAIKTRSDTGSSQVDVLDLRAGANWEYNKYFKMSAYVDTLDSKVKNTPSNDYKANSFNITSTLRY